MYIIQEMQTNNGNTAMLPAITRADKNEAESVYHQKLASAAISSVEIHTVIMYDEHGENVVRTFYEHNNA